MSLYINGVEQVVIHSYPRHTDVTRELFLPACEGHVSAGTPNRIGNYPVVEGGANADEPRVYLAMKVPSDFVSFISIKAIWLSTGDTGNKYWRIQADYAACGESNVTHGDDPAFGVTATDGTGIVNCQEPANPLALASLALDDYIGLDYQRSGSNALDTLDDVMHLLGLLFTYVGHQ